MEGSCCFWRWLLATATTFIARQANGRIEVAGVQVEVRGEFGAEGEPARNISYRVWVDAKASEEDVMDLMRFTDSVAEVQKTLRSSSAVTLTECHARDVR